MLFQFAHVGCGPLPVAGGNEGFWGFATKHVVILMILVVTVTRRGGRTHPRYMLILKFQADKLGTPCGRPDLFYDCALTPEDCKHTSYDVECNRYRYCEPNLCLIEDAASSELPWERERATLWLFLSVVSERWFCTTKLPDCFFLIQQFKMQWCSFNASSVSFRKVQCDPRHQCEARTAKVFLPASICKVFVDVLWYLCDDWFLFTNIYLQLARYINDCCPFSTIILRSSTVCFVFVGWLSAQKFGSKLRAYQHSERKNLSVWSRWNWNREHLKDRIGKWSKCRAFFVTPDTPIPNPSPAGPLRGYEVTGGGNWLLMSPWRDG